MPRPTQTLAAPDAPARYQVGMADLALWVAGVAIVSAVARVARPQRYAGISIDVDGAQAVAAVGLAVFLGLVLVRQAAARLWRRGERGLGPVMAPVAWRLGIAAFLGLFAMAEAGYLSVAIEHLGTYDYYHLTRMNLLTLVATLGMVGVVVGLSAGRARPRAREREWLLVGFSSAVGVVVAACFVDIVSLVLLAIDRAFDGMMHPDLTRPGLHDRILRAGLDTAPVLLACLVSGVVISRELRRPAPPTGTRRARCLRGLLLTLAAIAPAAGATRLLWHTIPRFEGCLVEGFRVAFRPQDVLAIVLGFAGVAVGLASRAADRPGAAEPGPAESHHGRSIFGVLGKVAIVLILLDVIASRVLDVVGRRSLDEWPWLWWFDWTDAAYGWLKSVLPRPIAKDLAYILYPSVLALSLTEAWLAWRVLSLMLAPGRTQVAPIDASLGEPGARRRLAWRSIALTILMIALLPTFFLAGLFALDLVLRNTG